MTDVLNNMAGMSKLASKLSSRNSILFAVGVAAIWISAKQFGPSKKRRYEVLYSTASGTAVISRREAKVPSRVER